MSALTIDTTELHKLSFTRRLLVRALSWIKEEYRLTSYAHIRRKAENGDARAQYTLGTMCEAANGGFERTGEAFKWYQKAAFQGIAEAQLTLGIKYLHGQGAAKNDSEALLWLRKAAEQGQPEAQYQLANLYREGRGTTRDLLQAAKWYRKAAERGHGAAKQNFKELNSASIAFDPEETSARAPGGREVAG